MKNKTTQEYAAAVVDLLDRKSGSIKSAYMYPITKIILKRADASTQIAFIVNADGYWEETQEREM